MLVSVLASGSEGNSTLIRIKDKNILIDLGMNYKYIKEKLSSYNLEPKDIDYVFITHTHSDHVGAMKQFLKNNNPLVFLDDRMIPELEFVEFNQDNICLDSDEIFFKDFSVEIFKTSHDAPGSRGYIFKCENSSFVYVTDTGYINQKNFKKLFNHSLYVFESNHDIEMLINGRYPSWLKARVRGDEGHLSNNQAGFYLSKFIGPNTKQVVLAHLSHENNDPDIALSTVKEELINNEIKFDNFLIAKQRESVDCIEV